MNVPTLLDNYTAKTKFQRVRIVSVKFSPVYFVQHIFISIEYYVYLCVNKWNERQRGVYTLSLVDLLDTALSMIFDSVGPVPPLDE